MAGRIPSSFIDELLARIDIVDVIDSRVPLKKAGKEYKACCPFHGEKTPSFTVSSEKQFYHCFGCGAHGTALGFLIEYEHLSFPEAVETLAQSLGLDVPTEGGQASSKRQESPLYDALTDASQFYQNQLRQHRDGPRAVEYLKQRGLSGDVAKRYGLGFAPGGYDNTRSALGNHWKDPVLLESGLLTKNDQGRTYDRFRDRIMFPIRDRRGRVIGFGGRVLGEGEPKYLNSPETPVFHKGRELYGLYEARTAGAKLDTIIVVEGYMDVVSLAQFGIHNAVAALGTSITKEQVELCFRSVQTVVFCFDGDRAGRSAAWRGAENALPVLTSGKTVQFLFLPDGHDPDTLVRDEGVDGFQNRMRQATDYSTYFFDSLTDDINMQSVDGRAALSKRALPLINQIRDPVYRELMMEELSSRVGMSVERLSNFTDGSTTPEPQSRQKTRRRPGSVDPTRSTVRMALTLLMHDPSLASDTDTPDGLEGLNIKGAPLLAELLNQARSMQQSGSGALLERMRDHPAYGPLAGLLSWSPPPDFNLKDEWTGVLGRIDDEIFDQRWQQLTTQTTLSAEERVELSELQQRKLSKSQRG